MQLAIAPLKDRLAAPPACFGVSGYSGAGTTPSDRNDPDKLRDNLMPYALVDHMHEREVTRQLGVPVEFMPHVAPHFRGITMTVNLWLQQATEARRRSRRATASSTRTSRWCGSSTRRRGSAALPAGTTPRSAASRVAPGGKRVVVVATLDNLLKGAATQAMQNLNRAFGFDELTGIPRP